MMLVESKTKGKLSFRIAYCGIVCAISVIIVFFSILPALAYTLPALAGLLIWTVKSQIDTKWGLLCYISSALLCAILVPQFEAVVFFISIFGYYPIVHDLLKKNKNRFLFFWLKLVIFNIPAVISFYLVGSVIGMKKMLDGTEFLGDYAVYGLWVMANVAFLCYDGCIGQFVLFYDKCVRPRFVKRIK